MRATCVTRRSGVRAPRRSWRLWLVMAAFGAVMFVPATATADPCGEIYVWADGGEGYVYGGAAIALPGGWGCLEWGYTGDVFILAVLYGPSAGDSHWMSGWMYAGVSVGAPANEPGTYYVDGHADVYYGEWGNEYHYDQAAVWVPPPSPPPPTITFSATEPITANYGSADVIITAQVSPAGYGYESLVYWQGDGVAGDTNLQRKFGTTALGTYSATAVIAEAGGGTEATTPEVRVVPTVSLDPQYISVPWSYDEYVTITATVQPENAAAVVWSGAGWTPTESNLLRHVPRWDVPGSYSVFANVGEDTEEQEAVVQIQEPILRLVLDEDGNFNHLSPSDDAPGFVPGTFYGGASRPVSEMRDTGHIVRLIAFFADPANPDQWLPPPPGAVVTFSLEDTTAWNGFAINAQWTADPQNPDPRDSAPDYVLTPVGGGSETSSLQAGFANGLTAIVELRARDYGGRTRVHASAATGPQATPLPLPRDANDNWIPDGGWWTGPETVSDSFAGVAVWTEDLDTTTPGAAGPPVDVGLTGDGLRVFEEYRGVIVSGAHVRTHPAKKDLFVSSLVARTQLEPEQSLDFARESLADRGARLHYLFDHTEVTAAEQEYQLLSPCPEMPDLNPAPGTPQEVCVRHLSFSAGFSGGLTPPPLPPGMSWSRTAGTLRLTLRSSLPGNASGLMRGACVQGGATPTPTEQAWWIFVDANRIVQLAQSQMQNTDSIVNNEVRRTAGHEIGHGLHVKHRAPPDPGCVLDSADVGGGPSMMNSDWGDGVGTGDIRSEYNDADVQQMRWHLFPTP
jgi:hypothetical protein